MDELLLKSDGSERGRAKETFPERTRAAGGAPHRNPASPPEGDGRGRICSLHPGAPCSATTGSEERRSAKRRGDHDDETRRRAVRRGGKPTHDEAKRRRARRAGYDANDREHLHD